MQSQRLAKLLLKKNNKFVNVYCSLMFVKLLSSRQYDITIKMDRQIKGKIIEFQKQTNKTYRSIFIKLQSQFIKEIIVISTHGGRRTIRQLYDKK